MSSGQDWLEYVTALTGSGSVLAVVTKLTIDTIRCRRAKKSAEVFQQFGEIYKALKGIQEQTCALRACVIKLENGGGVPEPGGSVKSSIIYEVPGKDVDALSGAVAWKNVPLNGSWAGLVQEVISRPMVEVSSAEDISRENAFLAADEFCDKVIFIRIAVRKTAFFFLSVHLAKDIELTEVQQRGLSAHVFRLRSIFGK